MTTQPRTTPAYDSPAVREATTRSLIDELARRGKWPSDDHGPLNEVEVAGREARARVRAGLKDVLEWLGEPPITAESMSTADVYAHAADVMLTAVLADTFNEGAAAADQLMQRFDADGARDIASALATMVRFPTIGPVRAEDIQEMRMLFAWTWSDG